MHTKGSLNKRIDKLETQSGKNRHPIVFQADDESVEEAIERAIREGLIDASEVGRCIMMTPALERL